MTLTDLTNTANSYTDESFSAQVTMKYANTCIGIINTKLKSKLPLFTDVSTPYLALSDSWLETVVIPYLCWSIKMNDGSINEAREYQYQFEKGLAKLRIDKKLAVQEDYRDTGFSSVYKITNYSGM